MTLSEIINLLDQSNVLVIRNTQTYQELQNIHDQLLALGNGLVQRTINVDDNPELLNAQSQLDGLISSTPALGESNDTLLADLANASNGLSVSSADPELADAVQLAFARNSQAKEIHEQAHLLLQAVPELDTFGPKLEAMQPSSAELAFLSLFRLQTDKLLLLSNYLDINVSRFVNVSWKLHDLLALFLNTPQDKVQLFNDNLPFALLPVRVETRFMTIKHVQDNLAYGSVNAVFRSDQDIYDAKSVRQAEILKAVSEPYTGHDLQEAPPQFCVADGHELWVRIYPDDISIHSHENDLTQEEINSAAIYWEEVWRAGTSNNAGIELGAWRMLCAAVGPKRAAWVAKQTTPTNSAVRPAAATPAPAVLSPAPIFPALTPKPASWSAQPHTKVMPDRFVVRVYNNSTTYREITGSLVPSPLPVGLDPSSPYSNYLNQSGAIINLPPELRWLADFEEAEKVGMGIRIPLLNDEHEDGFERLLVLGLKLNINATAGGQLLEELFDNHHYASGLSLVPQGTATNNTDDKKSGFTLDPGTEETFATERSGPLFTAETNHYLKADGQRLAEALGMNLSVFQNVANSNTYDVRESMAMTRALWSTTLGYYLKNLLTPTVAPADVINTRNFFTNYVLGRGLIPAFRVNNQPYGVLPATVHSRWALSDPYGFDGKLHSKILNPLRNYWMNNLTSQVKHVKPPVPAPDPDPDELLMNIIGLHPASIEFYQRLSCGSFTMSNMSGFTTASGGSSSLTTPFQLITTEAQMNQLYKSPGVGFSYLSNPRILGMSFAKEHRRLNGPVIDKLSLSETRTVEKIPNGNANYIQWLLQSPLSKIRNEDFTNIGAPPGQAPPQALLYLLLRHAWFLEYLQASHCLLKSGNLIKEEATYNYELINVAPPMTDDERDLLTFQNTLRGTVKSGCDLSNEQEIADIMRNLEGNPEYLASGLTPEQFEIYLRETRAQQVVVNTEQGYSNRMQLYLELGDFYPNDHIEDLRAELQDAVTVELEFLEEVAIDRIMANIENDPEYQQSGLSPEAYEEYLHNSRRPQLDITIEETFQQRTESYIVTIEDGLSGEQRTVLAGLVRSEVIYDNELLIADIMRNLSTNQTYLNSGMTPAQFEIYLRDASAAQVEAQTNQLYASRLETFQAEQSQWRFLTQSYGSLTSAMSMEDYLFYHELANVPCVQQLNEVRDALSLLQTLPTARLERCLAEHLDTCSFRLDAWLNGLVLKRLEEQRAATPSGIYVGAYSIVERLHPGNFPGIHVVNLSDTPGTSSWSRAMARLGSRRILSVNEPGGPLVITGGNYITPVSPANQQATFLYLGGDRDTRLIEDPVSGNVVAEHREDPDNGGFILAPSLNHAVTAAILRAGYVAHRNTGSSTEAMSVTLTSARVRTAMFYLEGIRNGQMLSSLLGYKFERGLHDRQSALPLDGYLFELREKFPLVAGSVVPTGGTESNNDAQMNHVVDGLKLLQVFNAGTPPYWYTGIEGLDNTMSNYVAADRTAIISEINKIKDDLDAIGDLLLAESVFQVSRGNPVRAGSVLQGLSRGNTIPEPEILKTPRTSNTMTHRCAVQLKPADASTGSWTGTSYRALAEPALNNWLASQLPDPSDIQIAVSYYFNSTPNTVIPDVVTINDLGLQPIDLVTLFSSLGSNMQGTSSELSKRVIYYMKQQAASDDITVTIDYKSRTGIASVLMRTIFELTPMLNGLVQVIGKSRALEPEDFVVPGLATTIIPNPPVAGLNNAPLITRLTTAITGVSAPYGLLGVRNDINAAIHPQTGPVTNIVYPLNSNVPSSPAAATAALNALRVLLFRAANFGIEESIPDTDSSNLKEVRDTLAAQALRVSKELDKRYTLTSARLNAAILLTDVKAQFKELAELAKIIFNRSFRVFPDFTLHNASEVTDSLNYQALFTEAGPYAIEEWMYGVARVRPRMGEYHKQMMLSESIATRPFTTQRVLQFPVVDPSPTGTDRWVGMKLPTGYKIPADTISMVVEYNDTSGTAPTCGMVIDEWTEQIPVDNVTTGIAMHYDQPSNEAPQAILLATTPVLKNYWLWNDLMDTLCETITMAAIRAVEPDMIETSVLAQVLPALVIPMNGGTATSPSLDLARNIIVAPPGLNNPVNYTAYTAAPQTPNDLSIGSN